MKLSSAGVAQAGEHCKGRSISQGRLAVMRMKSWFPDTAAAVTFHLLRPKSSHMAGWLAFKWASIKTDNHLKLRLLPRTTGTVILFCYQGKNNTNLGWLDHR